MSMKYIKIDHKKIVVSDMNRIKEFMIHFRLCVRNVVWVIVPDFSHWFT